MRILFLSRWYPYPADNGSKLRITGLLRGLCQQHDVTLLSFYNPREQRLEPDRSEPAPSHIRVCPFRDYEPGSTKSMLGFFSRKPRYLVDIHSEEMDRAIRETIANTRYDLVIASEIDMAAYYPSFRGVPAIFDDVELGVHAIEGDEGLSGWDRARKQLRWAKHAKFMSTLLENFALCTVVSEVERRLLASAVPGYNAVHVVPNSVSGGLNAEPPQRVPGSLIFTGSLRYGPNHDAVTWFLSEIFPAVREAVPGARLTITGDPGAMAPPPSPHVVLTGRVPDVRVLLASAAVSLAPIRTGAGTRIKILEAMALRTPVVATSKAMEGIEARHLEHLLIADTPAEFAQAVSRLLNDPAAASDMAERAWRLFRSRYDTEVVVPQFLRLVDHAAAAA